MNKKVPFSSQVAIGVMLFALFFGAGNLIFPAEVGQASGTNITPATIGLLITATGLPLMGVLAIAFSGSKDLQELSSRVHPIYAIFFTSLLYLTIGPFFASPRTATVAYEIGYESFIGEENQTIGLLIFSLLFFIVTLLFSLKPGKIVDNVGKILAPGIVILLGILLITVAIKPMGSIESPTEDYQSGAFFSGFVEGYNTMDALASLVFAVIVIQAVRSMGVTSKQGILRAAGKSGLVAVVLLSVIYIGIAYLGATSTSVFGIFDNGAPVLSNGASYYFGTFGSILIAIVITLACLTTAIGLTTGVAEYFHGLIPKISYKAFAIFFAAITFVVANFGLNNIITYAEPVLMFLYPLAIVLMLLTFLSPLFHHARMVYVATTVVTLFISIIDGFKSLAEVMEVEDFVWTKPVINFYENYLPMYEEGLGWLLPALIVIVIFSAVVWIQKPKTADAR